jgi:hypothetical protein
MEKIINTQSKDKKENHYSENIILNNRTHLHIDGIIEIISTSETGLLMKLKDTSLTVSGTDIHISKLDIDSGVLEADGNFLNFKYGNKSGNIFKRIFK